jgi:hypothetical protein
MNSQSIIPDFWEKIPTQPTKTQSQLSHVYGSLPRHQTPDSSHPPHHTQKSKSRQHQISGSESRPENYLKKANHDDKILGMMLGDCTIPKQVKPTRGSNIQVEAKSFLLFGLLNSQNIKEHDNHE